MKTETQNLLPTSKALEQEMAVQAGQVFGLVEVLGMQQLGGIVPNVSEILLMPLELKGIKMLLHTDAQEELSRV